MGRFSPFLAQLTIEVYGWGCWTNVSRYGQCSGGECLIRRSVFSGLKVLGPCSSSNLVYMLPEKNTDRKHNRLRFEVSEQAAIC